MEICLSDSSEIISGQNIARRCDYVFSHMVDLGNGNSSPVISDYLPLFKGGELIFCKTDYVPLLKQVLDAHIEKSIPLTLITHDSDYPVTDDLTRLFSDRPISWYGMNCCTNQARGIPIGIANTYCPITMKARDFERGNPSRLLYLNHRVETSPQERGWLYDHFSNKSWCTAKQPYSKGEIQKYKDELLDHKFIFCPRGNGVDTHRLWEALYCGVIPIVKRHRTHLDLEGNLPILFVDDYTEVTEDFLNSNYEKLSCGSWNMNMLMVSYWIDKIRKGM